MMLSWIRKVFSRVSPSSKTFTPIDWPRRKMIAKYFPINNADVRSGAAQKFKFETHVHAQHGLGRMTFFGEGDLLKVSVAWHKVKPGSDDLSPAPVGYTEHIIRGEEDLERLRFELSR